ncbi:hypothetical protein OG905_38490 [Streptomyces sp. NBC_00322]|uniref:effector-associated constant component EACC1 n=1 Tax=Streptomyces sp. NBC_00322 TaxID=2975712 RepID=UPI002E2BD446|nr:hypothetical protein [Streptomyces sp. NBC_00322]
MDIQLVLAPDRELDPEAGEQLMLRLRAELSELDIESLSSLPGAEAPDGAKAVDPVTLGTIVVALSASGGVFTALIETLRDWLGRQSARHRISVTIDGDTIELERASADERRDLIDGFVRRHLKGK